MERMVGFIKWYLPVFPLGAVTVFADPFVRYGLRFQPVPVAEPTETAEGEPAEGEKPAEAPQVVSLDAFRRRPPTKS